MTSCPMVSPIGEQNGIVALLRAFEKQTRSSGYDHLEASWFHLQPHKSESNVPKIHCSAAVVFTCLKRATY